jgi:ferric-chelate reductase
MRANTSTSKKRLAKSNMQKVVFIWSVREAGNAYHPIICCRYTNADLSEHVRWISEVLNEALEAAQTASLVVDCRVYITGSTPPTPPVPVTRYTDFEKGSVSPDSEISEKDIGLPAYFNLQVIHGRPSIRKILQEEINMSSGPVSVDGRSLLCR